MAKINLRFIHRHFRSRLQILTNVTYLALTHALTKGHVPTQMGPLNASAYHSSKETTALKVALISKQFGM